MGNARAVKKPSLGDELVKNALSLRTTKSALFSLLFLAVTGLIIRAGWHVPVALGAVQLLVAAGLLAPLTYGLYAEPGVPKVHEKQVVTFGFGLLAALLAYTNFLFYFARAGVPSSYVSTKNPYYFEACAIAVLTLLFCQFVTILFLRAHDHEQFFTPHLHRNKQLWQLLAVSLVVLVFICYVPPLRRTLGIGPISFIDWLWAIVFTGIYAGCRLLQRHTRKHARHAVLELHRSKQV